MKSFRGRKLKFVTALSGKGVIVRKSKSFNLFRFIIGLIGLLSIGLVHEGQAIVFGNGPGRSDMARSIRDGFAATVGFEIVSEGEVPVEGKQRGRSVNDGGYVKRVTYLLDSDPGAHKVYDKNLKPLAYVTLAWKDKNESYPFIFDFYIHGDSESKDALAIRVPDFDIRKFLHQSIAPLSDDRRLARLQAYFGEFSRKAKIIYPLPGSEGKEGAAGDTYESKVAADLRETLSRIVRENGRKTGKPHDSLRRAIELLERPGYRDFGFVDRILSDVERESSKTAESNGLTPGDLGELERLSGAIGRLNTAMKIHDLVVTNNCREPGNYEIKLRDSLGRQLFRDNFTFPSGDYDEILTAYTGIGIKEQGTGIRVPPSIRTRQMSRYWDSLLPWKWIKRFPKISTDQLSIIRAPGAGDFPNIKSESGFIQPGQDRIPFWDYEVEVRNKSAFHVAAPEPLSYVRVDPTIPPPAGFESPTGGDGPTYWRNKENAGKAVPHRFRSFSDLQQYEVYLSGFEANGIYIGKSDLEVFDKERQDGRWRFDYRHLKKLKRFEVRQWGEGYLEIRLLADPEDNQAVNFLLGNLKLKPGESAEFLFGIGTQPLIAPYNKNVYQDPLLYGFAFDSNGMILDHHRLDIGVERVYIERLDKNRFRVRLISYERILPLWEGILSLPNATPPKPSAGISKGRAGVLSSAR